MDPLILGNNIFAFMKLQKAHADHQSVQVYRRHGRYTVITSGDYRIVKFFFWVLSIKKIFYEKVSEDSVRQTVMENRSILPVEMSQGLPISMALNNCALETLKICGYPLTEGNPLTVEMVQKIPGYVDQMGDWVIDKLQETLWSEKLSQAIQETEGEDTPERLTLLAYFQEVQEQDSLPPLELIAKYNELCRLWSLLIPVEVEQSVSMEGEGSIKRSTVTFNSTSLNVIKSINYDFCFDVARQFFKKFNDSDELKVVVHFDADVSEEEQLVCSAFLKLSDADELVINYSQDAVVFENFLQDLKLCKTFGSLEFTFPHMEDEAAQNSINKLLDRISVCARLVRLKCVFPGATDEQIEARRETMLTSLRWESPPLIVPRLLSGFETKLLTSGRLSRWQPSSKGLAVEKIDLL